MKRKPETIISHGMYMHGMYPSVLHLGPLPLHYEGNLVPLESFPLKNWHLSEPNSNPWTDKHKELIRR